MPFKFFWISMHDNGLGEGELNQFLRGHRVLAVERRWVEQGSDSYWAFCVDYHESTGGQSGNNARTRGKDYKTVLSPEDFALFAKLRELRKELAQAEAVPVYTVFSNEQLAQMVQLRVRTSADLERIDGIGESRIEKYGARFLDLLSRHGSEGPDE